MTSQFRLISSGNEERRTAVGEVLLAWWRAWFSLCISPPPERGAEDQMTHEFMGLTESCGYASYAFLRASVINRRFNFCKIESSRLVLAASSSSDKLAARAQSRMDQCSIALVDQAQGVAHPRLAMDSESMVCGSSSCSA